MLTLNDYIEFKEKIAQDRQFRLLEAKIDNNEYPYIAEKDFSLIQAFDKFGKMVFEMKAGETFWHSDGTLLICTKGITP